MFADPELTLGLPPAVTAATGMDALTHNVESYLSPAYHPLCDGIALEGARIAARALVDGGARRANLQARSDMMMSSMMGAIAFQKDLGAVHSCAHALGTVCDLHHGLANALMIEPVLAWNCRGGAGASSTSWRMSAACRAAARRSCPGCASLKAQIGIAPRPGAARREGRAPAAPGELAHGRHLPPDQPAPVHAGRFRAAVPGRAMNDRLRPSQR